MDDPSNTDDLLQAGFRLSWPGHGAEPQPDRRRDGRLTALLWLALPQRRECCTGWPVTLSAPRTG